MSDREEAGKYEVENQQLVQGQVVGDFATVHIYTTPPPPPMQVPLRPPSQRQGKRMGLIVGIRLLLLILVGSGVFMLLSSSAPSHNPYALNMGTLVLNDLLHDNSRGYKWDEAPVRAFVQYKQQYQS